MRPLSIPVTDADHVLGRLDAPVILVEYGDYDCPHTRRAHANLQQLMAENDAQLALVFRQFPLRHLHQNAQALALLMRAIDDEPSFWLAHARLMAEPRMSLELGAELLGDLGLDVRALAARQHETALLVEADVQRGLSDGVHSTPSFFFNGAPHDGHYDLDSLRERLAKAPAR
jgi:protein-disulfide isomerase